MLCVDDPVIRSLLPDVTRPTLRYGFSEDADVRGKDLTYVGAQTHFTVCTPSLAPFKVSLNLPGKHNALNALAAIAVAMEVGADQAAIEAALNKFEGIGRRFNIIGDFCPGGKRVTVVDDYGHHPSEVRATLEAARNVWPDRRLVLVFQPHRYSRTRDCFEDFSLVLSQADGVVLTTVYAAGEAPIDGADTRSLCRSIRHRGLVDPVFAERIEDLPELLSSVAHDGDVLLVLGAGSIGRVPGMLVEQWERVS